MDDERDEGDAPQEGPTTAAPEPETPRGPDAPSEPGTQPGGLPDAAPDDVRPEPSEVSLKIPILLLLVPAVVLTLGSLLWPEVVWEQFVDKYYWTPIVNDEGFNNVNTISWAVLMAGILFLLARIVQKCNQPVTFSLVLAVVPYIMAGSVTRVLEDTGYFVTPLRYFFITPIIYVVITGVAAFWLVVGNRLKMNAERVGDQGALIAFGAFLAVLWVLGTFWSLYGDEVAHYPHPIITLLALAVPYAYFWNYTKQRGEFSRVGVMATVGAAYLIVMIYMVVLWHTGQQWGTVVPADVKPDPYSDDFGAKLEPLVYIAMFVSPAIFTALVYYVAKARVDKATPGSDVWQTSVVFLAPINLLLVFAQMMDATMTSLGIDFLGYQEKHVLPGFLIEWVSENNLGVFSEYAATTVMIPIKFAVSLLVIWAIDIYARRDMEKYPDLVGLAKLAIIMVGLAPGTRDAVRMAMDV